MSRRPHLLIMGRCQLASLAAEAAGDDFVLRVHDEVSAAEAVLRAAEGHRVLIAIDGPGDLADSLYRDLRRLGGVETRAAAASPDAVLSPPALAVLAELARGRSLGEAAQALHLSRRTADRRLADARRALGVNTTAEAVLAYRLGRTDSQEHAGLT
jgi:DNA-binding NarL/FixJ family response regulator